MGYLKNKKQKIHHQDSKTPRKAKERKVKMA